MSSLESVLNNTDLWHVEQGDSLDILQRLPDCSIDSVVIDPPAGIGFMGKPWDSFRGYVPRTAIGRDVVAKLETTKLPKKLREALRAKVEAAVLEACEAAGPEALERVGGLEGAKIMALRAVAEQGLLTPWQVGFIAFMVDVHVEHLRVLKPGAYMISWALPRTQDLAGMALRLAGFGVVHAGVHLFGGGFPKSHNVSKALDKMVGAEREVVGRKGGRYNYGAAGSSAQPMGSNAPEHWRTSWDEAGSITAPSTDAAKRWDGYHTQLAPGHEIWHVSRKPTPLTYARNVLEHGCGALNIGATRVPRGEIRVSVTKDSGTTYGARSGGEDYSHSSGSWPRDVLLSRGGDQCPVEGIDLQSGEGPKKRLTSAKPRLGGGDGASVGLAGPKASPENYDGQGGASRYFTQFEDRVYYGPKASDRSVPGDEDKKANKHPTHKHPSLMCWLVSLITPTAKATGGAPGVVLDSFNGSGTTGLGALLAEAGPFRYIGLERNESHVANSRARLAEAERNPTHYDKVLKRGKYAKKKKRTPAIT